MKAASKLGASRVSKLVLYEPPFNAGDDEAKREFADYSGKLAALLEAGKRGDAAAFFLADMVPAEMLEDLRQSPAWPIMEAVAPTLAYDHAVMGDGSVPIDAAKAASMPALVLVGGTSPEFKHEAVEALAQSLPHAKRQTLEDQLSMPLTPEALAPVLVTFFKA